MSTTPTCSHCGEPRTEDQPHDSQRCWTIAHAYAVLLEHARPGHVNDAPEWAHHIVELSRWLQAHPNRPGAQKTSGAIQARRDREISLDRWVAKAQLIANQGGKP
jgi:hypothetical protein